MKEDLKDGTDNHTMVVEVIFGDLSADEPTASCIALSTETIERNYVRKGKVKNNVSKNNKKGKKTNIMKKTKSKEGEKKMSTML